MNSHTKILGLSETILEEVAALQFKLEEGDLTPNGLVRESKKTGEPIAIEAARKILDRQVRAGKMVKFNRVLVDGYRASVYRPIKKGTK